MAIIVKKAAVGDAPATGTPKTPAPKTFVAGPDIVSLERAGIGGGAYGENHYEGSSSAGVNRQPISPMAASLKAGQDDGEGLLDTIQKRGTAALGPDWQTRQVSTEPFKPAFGMKSPSAPAKILSKIGSNPGSVARKPV